MLYFSASETCSGIFLFYIFHVCNLLWYLVLYFSACETCSGILCYIFLCVERALVFCVIFFCVWNTLCYFVLYIFLLLSSFCVIFYLPCFNLLFLFRLLETIFDLCTLVLWNLVLYCSACRTRSVIVLYIFNTWNMFWCCGTYVLYISACIVFLLYVCC